jgi:hypothetical protein
MRHHHEMLDIPSERWQPYYHPDAASSRGARHPRRALAPYYHPQATKRPLKSMSTSTRDIRPHRILVEAYNKRSYGDDTTTDNEFNLLTSPEDNQLVIKEGKTKNIMIILVKPTVETYGDY